MVEAPLPKPADPPSRSNGESEEGTTSGADLKAPPSPPTRTPSGSSCAARGGPSASPSPPSQPPTPPPPLTGMDEEAWQLQQLDVQAVRQLYAEVLEGGEPLVLAALKRGVEQLLDTLGVR